MDPYIEIIKKFTKKFGSKVINRQYFHIKTKLQFSKYLSIPIFPQNKDWHSYVSMLVQTFWNEISTTKVRLVVRESCVISAFTKNFFEKLRMIEIGARGRWKRSSIFQMSHPSKKSMHPKANEQKKKRRQFVRSFTKKKIQKVLMKIEEMADIFLNSANFASHAFLTLAAPSPMLWT